MSHPELYSYKPQVKACHECGSKEGYSLHWRCLVCGAKYISDIDYFYFIDDPRPIKAIPTIDCISYDRFMRQPPHRVRRGKAW